MLFILNVAGNTIVSNNLIIKGTTSYTYLGVGSNEYSSFISMIENKDMYISTPDISTSLSKMYVKSNQSINLHSSVFDWDNMTSRTAINLYDDGVTGPIKLNAPKVVIGNDLYNYIDSLLEVHTNFIIRKMVDGESIQSKVGSGQDSSYIYQYKKKVILA